METNNSIHTAAARSLIRIELNKDSAIELDTLSKEYTASTLFANSLQTVCKPALTNKQNHYDQNWICYCFYINLLNNY